MRVVAQDYVGYFLDDILIPLSEVKWKNLAGKPYVWHVVERLKRCKKIDEVVLTIQDTPQNKKAIDSAEKWDLNLYYYERPLNRNSRLKLHDSLNADVLIYTTAIPPLIDPGTLDSMINYFIEKDLDYIESEGIPVYIFKTKVWPKLYELEKDFGKITTTWTYLVKERKDLFKSDIFGKLEEIKILGKNPILFGTKIAINISG